VTFRAILALNSGLLGSNAGFPAALATARVPTSLNPMSATTVVTDNSIAWATEQWARAGSAARAREEQ
jgi:hypothetical protein